MTPRRAYRQYLNSADLATVERAFVKVCEREAIKVPSPAAETVAADLIAAFQRGVRGEDHLMASLGVRSTGLPGRLRAS
jgi:hypothetical protein